MHFWRHILGGSIGSTLFISGMSKHEWCLKMLFEENLNSNYHSPFMRHFRFVAALFFPNFILFHHITLGVVSMSMRSERSWFDSLLKWRAFFVIQAWWRSPRRRRASFGKSITRRSRPYSVRLTCRHVHFSKTDSKISRGVKRPLNKYAEIQSSAHHKLNTMFS